VNVYHGMAGALYVAVDAVVVFPTTCLSISTHRLERPGAVPGNVQFCSRVLKEWEESGKRWYTQRKHLGSKSVILEQSISDDIGRTIDFRGIGKYGYQGSWRGHYG